MSETKLSNEIAIALSKISKGSVVTFRNNVLNGLCGKIKDLGGGEFHVSGGRRIQAGLCPGSSDRIGYRSIIITPDMVGQKIAVIVCLEVKTPTGRATQDQINFINQVRKAGGRAGIVRSIDDAVAVCDGEML